MLANAIRIFADEATSSFSLAENQIMIFVWLAVFVVALLVELFTTELVSVWFCIGALVALILSFFPAIPYYVSIIVFLVLSALCLVALRPLSAKVLARRKTESNIDEIIGQKGKVTQKITELDNGLVKIRGVLWTAVLTEGAEDIEENSIVEVVSVSGNKLYVRKLQKGNR